MHSIKPGRGPSVMGAVGGVVAVVFGVFWTIMASSMTENAPGPMRFFFPLFGVLFVVMGIANVVYNLYNASNPNRLSHLDITSGEEEPDPLNLAVGGTTRTGRSSGSSTAEETTEEKLRELQELRDKGLVTDAEYSEQRRRILDSI
jgi:hypothetical protein